MAVTSSTLALMAQTARDYLRDPARFFKVTLTGHGQDEAYELPAFNINPTGLVVKVDGTPVVAADYTLYDRDGYISFDTPPASGALIYVEGTHWEWLSETDLSRFMGYALDQYSTSEGEDGLDDLLESPDFLNTMSIAGLVEALWALWTEASREIDVSSPEVSVPVRQRYQQLTALLQRWESELARRSQMLNIGRGKIEVLPLRRVSRSTGRLVPVFESQEIEERGRPRRVRIPASDLKLTGDD